jgi:hypothetical protein
LDANPEIVVIESIEKTQGQVRDAKGKGKRLMFQEMEKQVSQPKRPRTMSELKKMAEQTQETLSHQKQMNQSKRFLLLHTQYKKENYLIKRLGKIKGVEKIAEASKD